MPSRRARSRTTNASPPRSEPRSPPARRAGKAGHGGARQGRPDLELGLRAPDHLVGELLRSGVPAQVGGAHAFGDRLQAPLADRPAGRLALLVLGVGEQCGGGQDHRHRVRDVLAEERRRRSVRRLGHQRRRDVVLAERDEQRLRPGDRAEERQHEVGEDVAITVQCRDHHRRATGRDQQREGGVDQLRLVLHVGMTLRRRVHLLLQHPLVHGADRVLGAAEHLGPETLGLPEGELGDGVADASLDALGAKCDLALALALTPLPGAVGVSYGHAHDRDGGVHAAERNHAGDPSARADDHLAADLLAQDPVGRADVAGRLGGNRRRLQAQPVVANCARRLEHDVVGRPAAMRERQVVARQGQLHADHVGLEDAERRLEQLLACLVSLEDDDCAGIHRARL